jgi:peptidoglycan/xylan/chitin deacetylase (PgdA/CDA1 family)
MAKFTDESTWRELAKGGLATTFLGRSGLGKRLPRTKYLVKGPTSSQSVALTYDDGPHPEHTPALLDALKREGIKATFFVIGRQAERHPAILRRISAEGHAIGGHTFTHTEPAKLASKSYLDEIFETNLLFRDLLGTDPVLFMRPPFGRLDFAKLFKLWHAHQAVVMWNVDLKDYVPTITTSQIEDTVKARTFESGDIVLMHDNHAHAAALVPTLAAKVREKNLGFTTVLPWLNLEPSADQAARRSGSFRTTANNRAIASNTVR